VGRGFLEISYFLLGEPLARCKLFSEMNLQLINIIGDMFTNLADFFPEIKGATKKLKTHRGTYMVPVLTYGGIHH